MKQISVVLFLVFLTNASLAIGEEIVPRFAIYRVNLVDNELAPPLERWSDDPRYTNCVATEEYVLATAVKHKSPILTDSDIVEYCWATQQIQLTAEGAQRWNTTGGWDTPLTGLPILIYVDSEPQYAAFIWTPISSFSCKLPVFWCNTNQNRLTIGGMFISATSDTTKGAPYDQEVKQVMGALGKLAEDCRVK